LDAAALIIATFLKSRDDDAAIGIHKAAVGGQPEVFDEMEVVIG
jgi:hypothetical protein